MRVLYILPSFNIFGGTPKKTLDLMKQFGERTALYVYHNTNPEFKETFEQTGARIYEGPYKRNIVKHIRQLLKIIDENKTEIVQTQFTMGETLGYFIKLKRPRVKLIITFEGSFAPGFCKKNIVHEFYKKSDAFVYISNYVKSERIKQFPLLRGKKSEVIYNGTEQRADDGATTIEFKGFSLLAIAALIKLKNIQVIIKALDILVNIKGCKDIFFYVAGDGPERKDLVELIANTNLTDHVTFLGYQKNVGRLLNSCDIFVHPAYAEGFGIAVAEAMMAGKPIIVANAGGLPELIQHEKSGLLVDPFNALQWAESINMLMNDPIFAKYLSNNARLMAKNEFSIEQFSKKYDQLYHSLVSQ